MDFLLVVLLLLFVLLVVNVGNRDSQRLTLSVESVDFIVVFIVETLLGEILFVAGHWNDFVVCDDLCFIVVEEMVMVLISVVEQVDKYQCLVFVINETTIYEWIWEIIDRHCMVIKIESFIDIKLVITDCLFTSVDVSTLIAICLLNVSGEHSQIENSVI